MTVMCICQWSTLCSSVVLVCLLCSSGESKILNLFNVIHREETWTSESVQLRDWQLWDTFSTPTLRYVFLEDRIKISVSLWAFKVDFWRQDLFWYSSYSVQFLVPTTETWEIWSQVWIFVWSSDLQSQPLGWSRFVLFGSVCVHFSDDNVVIVWAACMNQ